MRPLTSSALIHNKRTEKIEQDSNSRGKTIVKYNTAGILIFTVDFDEKIISFYVVPDYSKKNRKDSIQAFRDELCTLFPGMNIEIFEAIDI